MHEIIGCEWYSLAVVRLRAGMNRGTRLAEKIAMDLVQSVFESAHGRRERDA